MRSQLVREVRSGNIGNSCGMFKKKKDSAISAVTDNVTINEIEDEKKKVNKKLQREKYKNCKRCWGFGDFLKTSWKLFKEFSADTSIHGNFLR